MIHILYVGGMFGSTIDFVLRTLADGMDLFQTAIAADGSMHTHAKQFHPATIEQLVAQLPCLGNNAITNISYPMSNCTLPVILTKVRNIIDPGDKFVLVHARSIRDAELNLLFQFHKIAQGTHKKLGLGIFCGQNQHNIIAWNSNYQHWSDMRPWELREWFSLFYVTSCQEWVESPVHVDSHTLCVTNTDILYNFSATVQQIILHCGLQVDLNKLATFGVKWQKAQQYIVDEFNLLDCIVDSAIASQPLEWQPINIIAEAIVQQRLRAKGYEIRCNGLDTFPTNAIMLHNLLEKVSQ